MQVTITPGFANHERDAVATLYWQAFGRKLGRCLGPDRKALRFLKTVLDPAFALVARDGTGCLLGIAGVKTEDGAFVGGGLRDLQRVYGLGGGLWRGLLLSALERDVAPDVLLMDGICVHPNARGHGIGSALLSATKDTARRLGKQALRLDVIDDNPRAKALYLREGFVPQSVEHTGPLRVIFGFRSATQMRWRVDGK